MLLFRPLLLLGDITGLLWLLAIAATAVFLALLIAVLKVGQRSFVAQASTPAGKSRRSVLLFVAAPVIAIVLLYVLLLSL